MRTMRIFLMALVVTLVIAGSATAIGGSFEALTITTTHIGAFCRTLFC